ncbi:hypothetical protein KP509_07G023100 [Ceratopteris richardii]|uniref:Uncharacterized protein n=1 Tax=Ceratopteris richardii TaxID=49495 RepID=A0A8T2UJC1_CERRI|nr:hypothetical protein KP509_07G023100 [Ceratopteris richardii]
MDSNDPWSPFVLETRHIVHDDLLSTARRKRRATRMSYMPHRPRKRPAGDSSYGGGSICSFGNFLRDKSTAFECKYLGSICSEGRASRVLANGLQRSLSFPTDSYEISKSILCVTRIGIPYRRIRSQENKAECLQTYSVGLTLPKDTSNVPSPLVSSGHCVGKSPLHLAKAVSDIPLLHPGNASFERDKNSGDGGRNPSQKSNGNVDMYALERAKQSFDGIRTPSHELNSNLDTYTHKVDTRDSISPKLLTDDLHLVGRTALVKSTEGELCNISRDCTLMVNEARSPPSAKMLTCGRRREMEDTAVSAPSFMKIPKCSSSENAQSDADLSDLHFYAVYDGHGGSQMTGSVPCPHAS